MSIYPISIICTLLSIFSTSKDIVIEKDPVKQTGTVQANGITIAWEGYGNEGDDVILLIQGTGAQLTAWPDEFCIRLAADGYRVIRFDNRDVGLSSKMDSLGMPDWANILPYIGKCNVPQLPYSLEDMSKDVIGLMDALKIKKAHLVGVSMGGAIAQLTTIHYPERVLSLTSIMASSGNPDAPKGNATVLAKMATPPPGTGNRDSIAHYLLRLYKAIESPDYPKGDSILLDMAKQQVSRSWYPAGNFRQAAAVIIGESCDRRSALKHISVPTLVIHGEDDPVVNVKAGKEVADAVPGAIFLSFPGMGHDLPEILLPKISASILSMVNKADTDPKALKR